MMKLNELSGAAVDIAYQLHRKFGPGLYEKTYEKLYCVELFKRGINYQTQVDFDLEHGDYAFKNAFKADLVLDQRLIIEVKSCTPNRNLHFKQLYNYLKLSGLPLGLVINFNVANIKNGIIRVINSKQ